MEFVFEGILLIVACLIIVAFSSIFMFSYWPKILTAKVESSCAFLYNQTSVMY